VLALRDRVHSGAEATNWGRPYTTTTVLPVGITEVVRETPGEGVLWAFPPRSDACDVDKDVLYICIYIYK